MDEIDAAHLQSSFVINDIDFNDESEGFSLQDDAQAMSHSPLEDSVASQGSGGASVPLMSGDESVPDIMLLNVYCARAKAPRDKSVSDEEAENSWQPVRQWLSSHNAEEVRAAAEQRGESGLTALHFACRNVPPLDVIDVFLSIAADTVAWPDSFGWLPIHYACASGSDSDVIKALAENFSESKTTIDRRGRTPLHFALGDKPATPNVVLLLSTSGAAGYADDNGMLPLHYACAFGASEDVLYVLTEAYPGAIKTKDKRNRAPLHFALSNAGRKTVPAAVRLLLSLDSDIVNSIDKGPLPLRVLAEYALTIKVEDEKREEKRESVRRCLEHLINAKPDPTADFLTALQGLPDWLSEKAVVMPVVQIILNEKISQRFPTAVLMLDFYVLVMVVVSYSLNVVQSIEKRSNDDPSDNAIATGLIMPLYIGAIYFALRGFTQIISLISLKSFNLWLYNPSNYLNVAFVFLILFWAARMNTGTGDADSFRIGAAISITIVWVKLLAYLRNMLIDFAVFVGGVFYVLRRLAAFLTALLIILIAFAQMFFTVFNQTEYCTQQPNMNKTDSEILDETRCEQSELRPYCHIWDSFLRVYTMLLGEVDETPFKSSIVATVLFILFTFLVVILLANVLIAIVTDSYKVIQDQRAAIVFWTNRLDFVAEMDGVRKVLVSGIRKVFACGSTTEEEPKSSHTEVVFGKELWKRIMDVFVDDIEEGIVSLDFLAYTMLRIIAVFVIPLWLLLGLFTVGWLWPPQVREAVFTSTVFKHTTDSQKRDELRRTQVVQLQEEVKSLNDELLQELALDRTQVVQIKSQVAEKKMEIANEMRHIKRITLLLLNAGESES